MLISAVNNPYFVLNIVINIMWEKEYLPLNLRTAEQQHYDSLKKKNRLKETACST